MIDSKSLKQIKEITEEFFQKATIPVKIEFALSSPTRDPVSLSRGEASEVFPEGRKKEVDTVIINARVDVPEILIGEKGQTLIEIQYLLKIILNKKLGKTFYIDLDINDYKKKKIEYLKNLARDLADEAVLIKKEKVLFPMSAYERRIIHLELVNRQDVITESQGEGFERRVVIRPQ